jgi:fatty-acyl-CoA synthase/long-chain acyl-CoA synthetase
MAADRPPDILALHALANPDKPAVIEPRPGGGELCWSFAELNRQANRLANVMHDLEVRPRDKVIWCGRNSAGVVRIMHAALKLRATAVPLNYRLSDDETVYVTDNCDAVLVYVDAEYADLFRRIRPDTPKVRNVVVYDGTAPDGTLDGDARVARASDAAPPSAEDAGEGSTMIYTSGTSGRPKGALRQGAGDPEQVGAMLAYMGYRPEDVYLTTGPLYHSGPGGFMFLAHVLGNTVVVQRKFDPEDWLRLVERYRVTSTFSAPTPIRMVCNLPGEVKARHDRSSMRIMVANAAPWSQEGLSGRLSAGISLGGLRLDRGRGQHDPPSRGPAS